MIQIDAIKATPAILKTVKIKHEKEAKDQPDHPLPKEHKPEHDTEGESNEHIDEIV
ncbi:MAG: hypothetical protein WC782_14275 [Methylococcaceae bacterium]|jgi:hypothetical protein